MTPSPGAFVLEVLFPIWVGLVLLLAISGLVAAARHTKLVITNSVRLRGTRWRNWTAPAFARTRQLTAAIGPLARGAWYRLVWTTIAHSALLDAYAAGISIGVRDSDAKFRAQIATLERTVRELEGYRELCDWQERSAQARETVAYRKGYRDAQQYLVRNATMRPPS